MSNAMRFEDEHEAPRRPADEFDDPAAAMRANLKEQLELHHQAASQTWSNAESELFRALREAKRNRQMMDSWRDSVPSPLRRKMAQSDAGTVSSACPSPGASSSEDEGQRAERAEARTRRTAAARDAAFSVRAQKMLMKAADFKETNINHAKRRLRTKITRLLDEVRRRQLLEQHQKRERKFADDPEQASRFASTGKASDSSIGLAEFVVSKVGRASPRRAILVKSLTPDEHEMLRKDAYFFLGSQEPSATAGADEVSRHRSVQDLVDFFVPHRDLRELPIDYYVQVLQHELEPPPVPTLTAQEQDINDILNRTRDPSAKSSTANLEPSLERLSEVVNSRNFPYAGALPHGAAVDGADKLAGDLARMPCLGRHTNVPHTHASPTLAKVQEVYRHQRKMEAEAEGARRQETLAREAGRDNKVEEAKREAAKQTKELKEHNRRRKELAEGRKAHVEAETKEVMQQAHISRMQRGFKAYAQAEAHIDERRGKASSMLENWEEGVHRAEMRTQEEEYRAMKQLKGAGNAYRTRLLKLGDMRQRALEPPPLGNSKLKSEIQATFIQHLRAQEEQERIALAQEVEARLRAANERRARGMKTRYNLIEKAFGAQADHFDPKHHTLAASRQHSSWHESVRSAEISRLGQSASEPAFRGGR